MRGWIIALALLLAAAGEAAEERAVGVVPGAASASCP